MIKEIKYNGYTAAPSDYESPDGDLATSIGAILEDGSLHPLMQPSVVYDTFDAVNGYGTVLYVHETAGPRFYIVQRGNALYAETADKLYRHSVRSFSGEDIKQVTAVGNTLIVLTDKAMHYLLWKSSGNQYGSYMYLGTKIPECPISFGLKSEMIRTDAFTVTFSAMNVSGEFSDEDKARVTEQVLAKVNKFIADESVGKGKFLFPFFVRYAYRLYDGTLTMHSSPVLMIASSGIAPKVIWEGEIKRPNVVIDNASFRVCGILHELDYAASVNVSELKNWSDIVRSVEIFISKPIYTYDQNGQCTALSTRGDTSSYSVCKACYNPKSSGWMKHYQRIAFDSLYALTFMSDYNNYGVHALPVPARDDEKVAEEIRSTSQFYLLKSIKIEQLSSIRTAVSVAADYLQSLAAREVMTDDYDSHDRLVPGYAFVYNSRLNLANINKELYSDYYSGSFITHTNGYIESELSSASSGTQSMSIYFFIKQDGRDICLVGNPGRTAATYPPFLFLFYPNTNAYKAVISVANGKDFGYYEFPLEKHAFLSGAFYFGGWENPERHSGSPVIPSVSDKTVTLPNKIYTSEVNNPFRFPVLGINTVGTGTILGISSAAKALSEGQFGQFPLYAFTTEGVWALEVSSTGTYSARQPVTRDVCVSPHSITQIDSAVLFATARGIMLLSGSTAQCISDTVNSDSPFHLPSLPSSDALLDIFHSRADFSNTSHRNFVLQPFSVFLSGCRMIYDYIHQHIIVYNPSYSYAYVYSLKSQAWGMMYSSISSSVPSYPDALAMDSLHRLVDFSLTDAEKETALVITRPFKMGEPDVHKTVDTIIQRGFFKSGMAQVLYGSNDLYTWHTVWSSADKYMRGFHGTPYKAFRLALICTLSKGESLFGCSLQFTPRMVNRLR